MSIDLLEKAKALPEQPGVYIMKNKALQIIYIGKAKILKNRVTSYFQNSANHTDKVAKMVSQVVDFDYIITDSEFEALVLECSLIKQNSPKYNILLKDDKGYHYIKITKEPYPRISMAMQRTCDNANYLGPFVSSYSVKQTVDAVNRAFMLPTCNRNFPNDFRKARPCLNFHIKVCSGICNGKISSKEYNETIKQAISFIKNGAVTLIEPLKDEMGKAAEALDFERAARLRDRIKSIENIRETQKVFFMDGQNLDAIAFAQNGNNVVATILKQRGGQLHDKLDFSFSLLKSLEASREEFMTSYYANSVDIPEKILVDENFSELELLSMLLTKNTGKKCEIIVPQKGDSRKLVLMAQTNASEYLSKIVERTGYEVNGLQQLSQLLGLEKTPQYIEAYDISNLSNSNIVGGMVVFENGRPCKKLYKKFKINQTSQDDYLCMSEMIRRRFDNLLQGVEGFSIQPDLILLDGGKGHVSVISEVLKELKLDIPLFGMVKDSHHRTRAITSDYEIAINGNKAAFSFVTAIQDEVHRFTINYQKKLHSKTTFALSLTDIQGIGEKKALALLKHYKTKADFIAASIDDIRKIAKVSESTALLIKHHFE